MATSAASIAELPAGWANGPEYVGFGATGDLTFNPEDCLVWRGSAIETGAGVSIKAGTSDAVRLLLQVGAVLVRAGNWCARQETADGKVTFGGNARLLLRGEGAAAVPEDFKAKLKDEDYLRRVALVIMGTKVHFFGTNHHVGQGALDGLMAKIHLAHWKDMEVGAFRDAAWRMGHWVSTRLVYLAWGIQGMRELTCVPAAHVPQLTADLQARVQSGPAGPGRLLSCMAVLTRTKGTLFAKLLPRIPELPIMKAAKADILRNPIAYHPAAQFLTGSPAATCYVPPEGVIRICACLAHGAFAGSSISRIKSLPSEADVKGDTLFLQFSRVRLAIVGAALSDDQVAELMPRIAPGTDALEDL